ncbi:MAG: amidohydrolase family protein [Lachnospiraceae bacterium]|nr:amidohydrolase family protein [Lachnospiraceae bacterium]
MFGECHGHMFMNGVNYKKAVAYHKNGVDKDLVRNCLRAYQEAGITFFREGGDYLGVSSFAAEIAGDYGIDYRSPVFAIHKKGHYGGIVGLSYENLAEFVALVEDAAKKGADFIKIMFSGILDFDEYGSITGTSLALSEMKELVHICHEEGFAVMVHVNGREAVHEAIVSGVDSIEHGFYMTEEELFLLAETGTIWTPTVSPVGNLAGRGLFQEEAVEAITKSQLENVKKAFALGVHVALGSDAGAVTVPHVGGLYDEYSWLLQASDKDRKRLDMVLGKTEQMLKEKFRRR